MRRTQITDRHVFYKYKSLDNFEFIFDMLVRDRLYAAKLSELNDPMEGLIKADKNVQKEQHAEWEAAIQRARIASFTTEDDSELMWAHYADGGRGCLIGFELHSSYSAQRVQYKSHPKWDGSEINQDNLIQLLCFKLNPWKYEREYRVVETERSFIPIKVKSFKLGPKVDSDKLDLLEHMVRNLRPDIKFTQKLLQGTVNPTKGFRSSKQIFTPRPSSFTGCKDCADRLERIEDMSMYDKNC